MSENNVSFTVAGLEVTTTEQSNPAIPSWLSEALLVGQYWNQSGLLDRLQQQVRVRRGRMGRYEVCDFVLLLLAYAVSGVETLKLFFEQLESIKSVLMSVWQRAGCPVAATLSRFLADVDKTAVEQLRSLFEVDLLAHPIEMGAAMGLSDRTGKRWVVFDVDGTVKATRHRALVSAPTHPQLKRRSENACAPGYGGRKRGDRVRTRSTVACAHTHEWLGTFAAPGNGTPKLDLARACDLIERYLRVQGLTIVQGIVRLDGLYGSASYVSELQQSKIAYMIRCRDYHLLNDPIVEAALKQAPQATITYPDSPHPRELFDIPCLDSTRRGYHEPMRLVVVRMERFDTRKRAVGKCRGKYIHELFLTSLPIEQFTATDVLNLYNGRGGFEQVLSEEDMEQDGDRWCSWQAQGQSFWQILNQWVWNWRIRAGAAQSPELCARQTEWSPALSEIRSEIAAAPVEKAQPALPVAHQSDRSTPRYGAMTVAEGWGKSRHKYGGKDFKVIEDQFIECPEGHRMGRREIRYTRRGDMQMLFSVNSRICASCPVKHHCLSDDSKGTNGRRISVMRAKLPPVPTVALEPEITVIAQAPIQTVQGTQALIWTDVPATQLRREIRQHLRRHQTRIQSSYSNTRLIRPIASYLTRSQRAHRRLSWAERLKRNALSSQDFQVSVQLFGISPKLVDFLNCLSKKRSESS
ncbi:hypothetical protein H6G17_26770 [Chroococcidiopsis sp. FACHB-1243]|uniref:transposase n=1 Tax=Chroococcidiopsis sp. [FACHB-1243] TaxID=2692781 RepID=UPI0017803C16|nr:transposase [Chroococcidiopsis sp. [FACHB-1243]]MBD2309071.1 hypothetical protein [Chroococcidiopsis sp. [FACHB-1243]]